MRWRSGGLPTCDRVGSLSRHGGDRDRDKGRSLSGHRFRYRDIHIVPIFHRQRQQDFLRHKDKKCWEAGPARACPPGKNKGPIMKGSVYCCAPN